MARDLTQYLNDTELALVVEGLTHLSTIKQEAFEVVSQAGLPGGERFRPVDFAIPQITALLGRFAAIPAVAPSDLLGGSPIVGTFFKQALGDVSDNDAIDIGHEQFDATRHVLAMDLDEIRQLNRDSIDEIGRAHVRHDGPCQVIVIGAICHFFDTHDLSSITEDMLQAKRMAYGVEHAQAMRP